MSSRSHVGVALIELMVTISLIVILLALAVPSLQSLVRPDGHPKLLHLWPVKLLQAGRTDYDGSDVMAMRAAASLSR